MRRVPLVSTLLLAACGGGGTGTVVAAPAMQLTIASVEFAPGATSADLVVALTSVPTPAPVLLQLAIELPAALTVAADDALAPIQNVATLRGARAGTRYVVVCGDDQNPQGTPLGNGPLFRLRLVTTVPRQVGTHAITLHDILVAQSDGTAAPTDGNPTAVAAIVR